MNDDLISRSALKSFIDSGHLRSPTELCFSESDVIRIVDKQPSVKPMALRHATWRIGKSEIICAGNDGCYEAMRWSSSIQIKYFDGRLPDRCPHCGATMDGGAD